MTIFISSMAGFATVQDMGRPGYQAEGIPRCGAMDTRALARANARVGNARGTAAVEWALAGGSIEFQAHAIVAVAGAIATLARNGSPVSADTAIEFAPGDSLTVGRFQQGAYIYVAVGGGIDVPAVLGSRSTYLPAGFGGLDGRRLRAGDVLRTGPVSKPPAALNTVSAEHGHDSTIIRAVEGPDFSAFTDEFREAFWASEFTRSRSSNRIGYRLERDAVADQASRSAPSEPACIGAIQVPSGTGAIVLMADGPTVGGYPKIGVVAGVDIPALAQKTPGERLRFERIALEEAQRLLRDSALADGSAAP